MSPSIRSTLSKSSLVSDVAQPIVRRLTSGPPPSTPPEPAVRDRLSMPTLPALHHNSVPALIEQYRIERAADSEAFDKHTQQIKNALTMAKIERGGSDELLRNEYTVELASRLDAEIVEKWAEIKEREFVDSDHEDESDNAMEMTMKQPYQNRSYTAFTKPTKSNPTQPPSTLKITTREPKAIVFTMPAASTHTQTTGKLRYQTTESERLTDSGTQRKTLTTLIEITQDISNDPNDQDSNNSSSTASITANATLNADTDIDTDTNEKLAAVLRALASLSDLKSVNEKQIDPKVLAHFREMSERLLSSEAGSTQESEGWLDGTSER